jgi:hypothetical protein
MSGVKVGRQQQGGGSKAAWAGKNTSPAKSQARTNAKQAAEAKFAETTRAVNRFTETRDKNEPPSFHPGGSR